MIGQGMSSNADFLRLAPYSEFGISEQLEEKL